MRSVLLVDDQETIRILVRDALDAFPEELDIEEAADGIEAIAQLEKRPFDLLICDVRMPHKDGFEVLEWVRTESARTDMPVIMLTAEDQDRSVFKGFKLGATSYVTKPFNVEELFEAMRHHF